MGIVSIKHKGLKLYWTKGDGSKLPPERLTTIAKILTVLDRAKQVPKDFEVFRNWRIHPLKGELKGHWSLDVSGNFRITFMFIDGNAEIVDYQDTH
ncbi:MAG: hypothetical protein DI598_11575 [Pseudopedobacter saltans]|uniref:Plasmid maintenance system killer n=1 Tax=Pseudopedobacter saltans TaxID=151895 RepID=A0A2W5GUH0_9SPHI|nr:MAG: hypothetical protein DI598_11575 [Pseudopedobacter saltans]